MDDDDDNIEIRVVCNNLGASTGFTTASYYINKDTVAPDIDILSPAAATSFGVETCPFTITVSGVETGLLRELTASLAC